MNFIRTVVNSDALEKIISLPEELKHREVEILIFPIEGTSKKPKNKFNPDEYAGVLHIKNIEHEIRSLRDEWERF